MNLFNSILGPGSSVCQYYGPVDQICGNATILPITSFPKECSSFYYDSFTVDMSYTINFTNSINKKSNKKILNISFMETK